MIVHQKGNKIYKIFLSAGEASGDNLAANLINSLKKDTKNSYEFYGIAGSNMQKAGEIKSIFPIQELAVTGYLEVLPRLFKILFWLLQTVLYIKKIKPDVLVTIDAPSFNFLLAKLVKRFINKNIPKIHYVAPTVWAYNPERATKFTKLFDHMMVLFPFEKKYFSAVGLKCSYVGYPVADNVRIYTPNQKEEIRQKHGLHKYEKIIVIMPGSRKNELKYHLPVLKKFIQKISNENSNLCYFIATLVSIEDEVKMNFSGKNIIVSSDEAVKKDLIAASDLILCKSGTSVLESVAKRIPMIAFYKMNSLTAYLIKRKLKIKYITICNIVMNKEIIPELLQENFIVKNLLRESKRLLYDTDSIKKQIKDFDEFLKQFHNYNVEKPEHIIQDYLTREK